jgi:Rieske [2Fe-2S] domain
LDNGKLECRYHGWVFDAEGKCVSNPQADGLRAEATVTASQRSCLKRYPTRVEDGLLWVWPQPNAWVESLSEQPFIPKDEPGFGGFGGMPEYGFNVNPVTYASMVENSLGRPRSLCRPSFELLVWELLWHWLRSCCGSGFDAVVALVSTLLYQRFRTCRGMLSANERLVCGGFLLPVCPHLAEG